MLMYCKKCGRIIMDAKKCDICNSITYPVPEKYLLIWKGEIDYDTIDKSKKDHFIEECIKSSPEYDQQLFDNRDAIRAQQSAKYEQAMAIGNAIRQGADVKTAFRNGGQNMPKCPTCGSTNIKRISGTKRWLTTGLFGLASSDIGKTMVCKNCGFKF
nr:MAG TPA: RNA polymerase-like protein [Caudoviricetes sp.]